MNALVLAASFGQRMEPLTGLLPKPLLPLGNLPNLLHILHYLRTQGVTKAIVNLHHHPQRIREALETRALGLRVQFSEEPEILGTAGGIKRVEGSLRDETFIVINADIALEFNLGPALAFHGEAGALATLILKEDRRAKALGTLGIDSGGRLRRFLRVKAPHSGGKPLREGLFTGLHILEPEILKEIPPGRNCSISEEIYPRLLTRGRPLFGYFTEGYWEDLGTPSGYLAAHRAFLEGRLRLPLWEREGRGQFLPFDEERAFPQVAPPALLGEGVRLGPGSRVGPFSSLGEGCRVGEGARVERSVLWEGVQVGKGVELRDCIVAGGLRIEGVPHIKRRLIAPHPRGEFELRAF